MDGSKTKNKNNRADSLFSISLFLFFLKDLERQLGPIELHFADQVFELIYQVKLSMFRVIPSGHLKNCYEEELTSLINPVERCIYQGTEQHSELYVYAEKYTNTQAIKLL